MGETIRRRLRQAAFESPEQEAVLNLMLASARLRDLFEETCARHGITGGQYNVLRILRGAGKQGHSRCEIAERLIERAADVTRLIDRLEAEHWVERIRSEDDRRLSIARITDKGLVLLDRMAPEIRKVHEHVAARISARECRELSRLCEQLYGD
jgi:DNA-binding MarR family transcriptional regulator